MIEHGVKLWHMVKSDGIYDDMMVYGVVRWCAGI